MIHTHRIRNIRLEKLIPEDTTAGLHYTADTPEDIHICLSCPLSECHPSNRKLCPLMQKHIKDREKSRKDDKNDD